MAEAAKPETKTTVEALSPARFMESQRHNTALFTEANELMLKTARALWESQTELFRLEAEHTTNIAPPKTGENPAAAIAAYCDQLHERTDHLVAHMRKTNDLVRDYGWQLLGIYARGFGQAVRDGQAPAPMVRNIKA
jgi:Phasin protein